MGTLRISLDEMHSPLRNFCRAGVRLERNYEPAFISAAASLKEARRNRRISIDNGEESSISMPEVANAREHHR